MAAAVCEKENNGSKNKVLNKNRVKRGRAK
jgi:hypothetical protein